VKTNQESTRISKMRSHLLEPRFASFDDDSKRLPIE
jgi:hypothetical protein